MNKDAMKTKNEKQLKNEKQSKSRKIYKDKNRILDYRLKEAVLSRKKVVVLLNNKVAYKASGGLQNLSVPKRLLTSRTNGKGNMSGFMPGFVHLYKVKVNGNEGLYHRAELQLI